MSEEETEQPEITEEASETSEPEITSEGAGTSEEPGTPKNTGVQKRINEITADKHRERRRADALAKELSELKAVAPSVLVTDTPKLEDFDYDDAAFNRAYISHQVQKTVAENTNDQRKRDIENHRNQANQEFARKLSF